MLTLMKPNFSMRVLPRSALAVCLVLAMTMLTGLTSARAQTAKLKPPSRPPPMRLRRRKRQMRPKRAARPVLMR